jgi:AcrR family transcriptional regulator
MPPRLVSDTELVDRLTELFRSEGFESSSLAEIARATGLQKSSLYHRFPGGKEQMAADVAQAVIDRFAGEILAPLFGDGPAEDRIRAVGRNLDRFYAGGARRCLLDVLSVGHPGAGASAALADAANGWIAAFASVARAAGARPKEATARAQDAIAGIEGALVLARVTGDEAPFARAIDRLPDLLLGRT